MSSSPRFIHLRVHTEYSLLEGAVPVKKLVGLCGKMRMPAIAVTDTNNMFAALEFSVLAKGAGVQPIVGCQVSLAHDPAQPGERARPPAPLVLLGAGRGGLHEPDEAQLLPLPARRRLTAPCHRGGAGGAFATASSA